MEPEVLFFEHLQIDAEEQELGWEIFLAILTSLIQLDLLNRDLECHLE